jgi:hypothetical protein
MRELMYIFVMLWLVMFIVHDYITNRTMSDNMKEFGLKRRFLSTPGYITLFVVIVMNLVKWVF